MTSRAKLAAVLGTGADPEALTLLREIRDLLRELVEASRKPARELKFQDREAMKKILPVLRAHFDGTFSTWELIDCRDAPDVRGANLKLVLGKRTAKEIGQLFGRAAGQDFGGLRLLRCEKGDTNGARWQVLANSLP